MLEVADVERSLKFYVEILGLHPERLDQFRAGQVPFVSVRAGQSLIDLFPSPSPQAGPPHFCLAFEDPIGDIQATLRSHDIISGTPQQRFGALGMGNSLYVQDPDDHTVELRSYADLD